MTIIPGLVNGWLIAHLKRAAIHRNARHVRRGARLGLSVRRRHDRLDRQPLVQRIGNGRVFGIPILVILAAVAA